MYLKRRDVLLSVLTVGVAGSSLSVGAAAVEAPKKNDRGKRRAQYQPDSAEVNTFYRVNRYPVK